MIKASVNVNLKGFEDALDEINRAIDANCEEVAEVVLDEARASAAFDDKTGKLRKSIKMKESKFDDGGFIVYSNAPHAHLVEFGHDQIKGGRVVGHVEAHPFLRPAKEKGIKKAMEVFKPE